MKYKSTGYPEDEEEEHFASTSNGKKKKGVEVIRSVNMHQLDVSFVERGARARRPLDVR